MAEQDDATVRHQLANKETAPGIVRQIAREEGARIWESFGVDVTSPAGRLDHARVLDFLRSRYNKREEIERIHEFATRMVREEADIWQALSFAEKWRGRERELEDALRWVSDTKSKLGDLGKEGRKGIVNLVFLAVAALLTSGITATITAMVMRGGHQP